MKKFIAERTQCSAWNGKLDADELGVYLSSLRPSARNPQDIAHLARDPAHPFHKHLEWDDRIAGEKYREHQVRNIVMVIKVDTDYGPVREFTSLRVDNKNRYYTPKEIVNDSSLLEQAQRAFIKELNYFKEKNSRFRAYFGDLFRAIDAAEKKWSKREKAKAKQGRKVRKQRRAGKANRDTASQVGDRSGHPGRRIAAHGK